MYVLFPPVLYLRKKIRWHTHALAILLLFVRPPLIKPPHPGKMSKAGVYPDGITAPSPYSVWRAPGSATS